MKRMFKFPLEKGCMLVLGGAKSGKSRFALDYCNQLDRRRIFLATAEAGDQEMNERIRRHQAERGEDWETVEEPVNIQAVIDAYDHKENVILLDCLTLWLSNLFMAHDGGSQNAVPENIQLLGKRLSDMKGLIIAVSNEVGMGIVPEHAVSRKFRDMAGQMNQSIAGIAGKVVFIMSGLPMVMKDDPCA
jgi:adenosylcobinamide kinase/adenosylcobinamide-phosphate guanylyltransferase